MLYHEFPRQGAGDQAAYVFSIGNRLPTRRFHLLFAIARFIVECTGTASRSLQPVQPTIGELVVRRWLQVPFRLQNSRGCPADRADEGQRPGPEL